MGKCCTMPCTSSSSVTVPLVPLPTPHTLWLMPHLPVTSPAMPLSTVTRGRQYPVSCQLESKLLYWVRAYSCNIHTIIYKHHKNNMKSYLSVLDLISCFVSCKPAVYFYMNNIICAIRSLGLMHNCAIASQ